VYFKLKIIFLDILLWLAPPIERSYKKKKRLKKSKTIHALVQKIQLDEHGKFRYYVMFAKMDMPIYELDRELAEELKQQLMRKSYI
jgi:hypothetical protein